MFFKKKKTSNSTQDVEKRVKFMFKDMEFDPTTVDPDKKDNLFNRKARKVFLSTGQTALKRFGHYVHPETGERPDIIVQITDDEKSMLRYKASIVLKTDSESLREWLKKQGIVIGENIKAVDVSPSEDSVKA